MTDFAYIGLALQKGRAEISDDGLSSRLDRAAAVGSKCPLCNSGQPKAASRLAAQYPTLVPVSAKRPISVARDDLEHA
jgi:hypothetical protein